MIRKGKIACLPRPMRDELNRRLDKNDLEEKTLQRKLAEAQMAASAPVVTSPATAANQAGNRPRVKPGKTNSSTSHEPNTRILPRHGHRFSLPRRLYCQVEVRPTPSIGRVKPGKTKSPEFRAW
jgi:hypothetical protein